MWSSEGCVSPFVLYSFFLSHFKNLNAGIQCLFTYWEVDLATAQVMSKKKKNKSSENKKKTPQIWRPIECFRYKFFQSFRYIGASKAIILFIQVYWDQLKNRRKINERKIRQNTWNHSFMWMNDFNWHFTARK